MNFKHIITAVLVAFSSGAFAQIEIGEYSRQIFHDIDDLDSIEEVSATSTCGALTIDVKEQMFSGGCLGNLVRTYVFTDECGNKAEAEQYIVLQDNVAPVFDQGLEDITVQGNKAPKAIEMTATDNSESDVEISLTEEQNDNQLIRSWTARDRCGNETIVQQVITFENAITSNDQ